MASKVQLHCIKVTIKTGNIKTAVQIALMANIEGGNMVYLDNAKALCEDFGVTAHQFAGYLAALTREVKYKQMDGHSGTVTA